MTVRPVLVVGAEPRIAVLIARSLARRGVPVDVAYRPPLERAIPSRAIRDAFAYDGTVAGLLPRLEARSYDIVFPSTDSALAVAALGYEAILRRARLACPPPAVVDRVLDKTATLEIARDCGIDVPKRLTVERPDDVARLHASLDFPVVAKPVSKTSESDFKVRYFRDRTELASALGSGAAMPDGLLFQEFCPGVGVGIEVLIHEGEPMVLFQHRRLKEFPINGGVSIVATSEPVDADLAAQALALLRALEWEGVAMVEFRHDAATGRSVLMEVNGRYWGSMALPLRAGIDFPFYHYELLQGRLPAIPPGYRAGLRVRWTRGSVQRLHSALRRDDEFGAADISRVRELAGFVRDALPPTRDALWQLRDPGPALAELYWTLRQLAGFEARRLLRWLLPPRALDWLRASMRLHPTERRMYMRFGLERLLGRRRDRERALPSAIHSVLFVCHGNIIRSPMAEALLRKRLQERGITGIEVKSAGVAARPGRKPDPRAISAARDLNVSLADHEASELTRPLVDGADAIFLMDGLNEARAITRFPDIEDRTFLLGALQPAGDGPIEIADPYDGDAGDVGRCFARILRCIDALAQALQTPHERLKPDREVRAPA